MFIGERGLVRMPRRVVNTIKFGMLATLCLLMATPSKSMEFSIRQLSSGLVVFANGEIVDGDATSFLNTIEGEEPIQPMLFINSPGGSVSAAFELAKEITANKYSVIVEQECASACSAIIFPAGEYSMTMSGALLGFHSCYTASDQQVALWCNENIAKFAAQNGFPYGSVRLFMDAYGPTEMRWISEITASCFGFYRDFDDPKPIFGEKPCVDAMIVAFDDEARFEIGPSFNCGNASTNVEKLICMDDELMLVDAIFGRLYWHVRESLSEGNEALLVSSQKDWITAREEICDQEIRDLASFKTTRQGAQCISDQTQSRMIWLIDEFELVSF